MASGHSAVSNGTEYGENEFGDNLFDEVDFSHPDEVHLDASVTDMEGIEAPQTNVQAARQQLARVKSMPTMNGSNDPRGTHQRPPGQNPSRPPEHRQQTNRPDQGQSMPPPPNHSNGNAGQHQQPNQQQHHQNGPRSETSSAGSTHHAASEVPNRAASNGSKGLTPPDITDQQRAQQQPQAPETPTGPIGFVTGRVAGTGTVQPFNPHAESPSIPRTVGVNHAKSEPVVRTALIAQSTSGRGPTSGGPANAGPMNAVPANAGLASGPISRSNFVNPSADMNRRIGMPGGGMSPAGNRGAYKPPTAVKRPAPVDNNTNGRPALTDMSNMQQLDGPAETKKAKVDNGDQNQAPGLAQP